MKLKRWLCTLLVLCMVLTVLPMRASAATVASGNCGKDIKWTLDGNGVLTISGSGAMYDGIGIDDVKTFGWFDHPDEVKSVVIKSGVSYIGNYAFSGCANLESISIPDTVTGIGTSVLSRCTKLKSLTLPDSVTSVGGSLCMKCESLTSVRLPKDITEIPTASFRDCTSLTSINIPAKVRTIGGAFDGCENLTSVTFPEGLEVIEENAFVRCTSLKKITIPGSVTSIGRNAFESCVKLMNILFLGDYPNIPKGAFRGVVANAYYSVNNKTWTEDVRQDYGGTIHWIGVSDPSKVSVSETSGVCGENTKWNFDEATGTLTVSGSGKMEFVPWNLHKDNIRKVVINQGVTSICSLAFHNCKELTSVSIANSVKEIEALAFADCTKLPSISIPDSVTEIGYRVFDQCDSLTTVKLPAKLKTIEYRTFFGCDNLSSINIPNGVTSVGESAFQVCMKLSSITIPASVTFVDAYAFYGCTGLKSIKFEGPAPEFVGNFIFEAVTATVRYPADLEGWDQPAAKAHFNCNLTWKAYCAVSHTASSETVTEEPTCLEEGVASCICGLCGESYTKDVPMLPHTCEDGICTACGNSVFRLAGGHRWETALKVADEMKENLGAEKFDAIIIASGNDFADALAGSYLSTVKNAPILLSWGKGGAFEFLDTDNIEYIKANLAEGGTVYILGGTNAVPELYETELADYDVKRLGGMNRFETNLLILEEAGVKDGDEILVCTATNFADSLSASATGKPILLVFNEMGALFGKQPEFLAGLTDCTFTVIGGESAVSAKLAEDIGAYGKVERLAGANRFETSVLVAEKCFEAPEYAVLAYAWNYPDGLCGGALAFSLKAPLILTMTNFESQAAEYIQTAAITKSIVLGGEALISDDAVRSVFVMEADAPVAVK